MDENAYAAHADIEAFVRQFLRLAPPSAMKYALEALRSELLAETPVKENDHDG